MKVTLPNGLVVEGTDIQVLETLAKLGYDSILGTEYYHSSSKGLIKISEMETTHLRNAILKIYAQWVSDLHSITDPKELCNKMMEGITDKTWLALVKEYSTRSNVLPKMRFA